MSKLQIRDPKKYKEDLKKAFFLMEIELNKTFHLKKIIDEKWLLEFKSELDASSGEEPFSSRTHTIFIEFLRDKLGPDKKNVNIIQDLDKSFDLIFKKIGNQKIKSLRRKLGIFDDKNLSNYLGIVYETLIIGRFAKKSYLLEYEPKIPGSPKKAEAIIQISDQKIFVECTTFYPKRHANGHSYYLKMKDKLDNFKGIQFPVILFINPDRKEIFPQELEDGYDCIFNDPNTPSLSAIVVSYYYRADNNKLIINPRANFALNTKSIEVIKMLFP